MIKSFVDFVLGVCALLVLIFVIGAIFTTPESRQESIHSLNQKYDTARAAAEAEWAEKQNPSR